VKKRILKIILSFILAGVVLFFVLKPKPQGTDISDPMPMKYWNTGHDSPLVFYVSGDAGFNSFSKNFSEQIFRNGFDIYALNTKDYFWDEKTARGSAGDFSGFLEDRFRGRKNKQLVIVGYSFGADALPFILNRFPPETRQRILKVILIDPSSNGDLKITLASYINESAAGRWATFPELSKLGDLSFAFILSDFSAYYYPYAKVPLADKQLYRLPGNHRFDGNFKGLASTVAKIIRSAEKQTFSKKR